MVREWFEIHGWEVRECGNGSTDAKKRSTDRVSVLQMCLGFRLMAVTRVAAAERMSVQRPCCARSIRDAEGMLSRAAL